MQQRDEAENKLQAALAVAPLRRKLDAIEASNAKRKWLAKALAVIWFAICGPCSAFWRMVNSVDWWRRVLGVAAFAGVWYAADHVFDWIKDLKGDITWPRAVVGASAAGFLLASMRLVDRLTMTETLLAKVEEARIKAKSPQEADTLTELIRALTELVGRLGEKK
ncbi:MAG TPA: hypothetical protein VMG12_13185 [Polyangiaceae bacterium]|nr:hypothetical protein [Polyangiaceae bacterium]